MTTERRGPRPEAAASPDLAPAAMLARLLAWSQPLRCARVKRGASRDRVNRLPVLWANRPVAHEIRRGSRSRVMSNSRIPQHIQPPERRCCRWNRSRSPAPARLAPAPQVHKQQRRLLGRCSNDGRSHHSHPNPSPSPSSRWGSDPTTRTGAMPIARMSAQSRSGGGVGTQPPA